MIGFGNESLDITSWRCFCKYNGLKEVLGAHINKHLQYNITLREIFALGDIVSTQSMEEKSKKCEKERLNAASAKARKKDRNQQRDEKHAVRYEL